MKFLFLIWCITLQIFSQNYSIIFVHLGPQLPSYLKYTLHQARMFNQVAPIYLIMNHNAQYSQEDNIMLKHESIHIIFQEDLKQSDEHKMFLEKSTLDNNWKDGFWFKATERFFCIDELMSSLNLEHVFHMESDNMLYVDLQCLLPIFNKYKNIAAVFDNDQRCIASFIYFAHKHSIKNLTKFIANNTNKKLNDMEIIAVFKDHLGKDYIDYLPIIIPEYVDQYGLKNKIGKKILHKELYFRFFSDFNSIFDGAAIGQYLGGIDPIHGNNTIGFINESCIFNPSLMEYKWKVDECNRKIPYLIWKGRNYRINNLHIHSKELEKFHS